MTLNFEDVRHWFFNAKQIDPSTRDAWLHAHCTDPMIRAEVCELLAFDRDDAFLEKAVVSPPTSWNESTMDYIASENIESQTFAERFKLLQPIGEGGFGVVYMADQLKPVRRRVAIKLLRLHAHSKSVVARFESERQALAMMDHPNIAKVYDGGITEEGVPYFVMELVNGIPITAFCDANQLTNADRMKLLITVCHAVQHAHQKGVIHRDLKPSNLLVSMLDGSPIPKVIDFGIAKALHGPLTDKTLFTSFQQMIGTPEYMSPEQAETSILDADTRSDVYSLGVIAYELLTGTTPFDGHSLRKLGLAEIQRTIREVDPPKPSDRFSTLGNQAVEVAKNRGVPQIHQHRAIQGDLDWIVMKAMEKDRNRRYDSAHALADDLARWLQNEPIEARPPSVFYRSSKFLRRNHRSAFVGLAIAFGIVLSAIGLGYGLSERNASLLRQSESAFRASQLELAAQAEAERVASLQYGNAMVAANESFLNGRRSTTRALLEECPKSKRGIEWHWLDYLATDHSLVLSSASRNRGQRVLCGSPTSNHLYSGGQDGVIHQWDITLGKEIRSWLASDHPIALLAIDHESKHLLSASSQGEIAIWDPDTTHKQAVTTLEELPTAASFMKTDDLSDPLAFQVAIGDNEGKTWLWNHRSKDLPRQLHADESLFHGDIQTLEFLDRGNQLLAAGKGGVHLLNTANGTVLASFGQDWIRYGAFTLGDATRFVQFGHTVSTLNLKEMKTERAFEVPSVGLQGAVLNAQKSSLVIATEDQSLRMLDLASGKQQTIAYNQDAPFVQLAIAGNGESIAATLEDGSLHLWTYDRLVSPESCTAFEGAIASLARKDRHSIYALSDQGEWMLWNRDRNTKELLGQAHAIQGFSLDMSPLRDCLVSNGLDQQMHLWSTETHQKKQSLDLALGARYLAFHPNKPWVVGPMPKHLADVASSGLDLQLASQANLAVWNIHNGKVEQCLHGLTNWAMKLRFSSTGDQLAAATVSDGAVLWNMNTQSSKKFLKAEQPQVDEVAFSRDDKYLFAAYRNGQVGIWNIATQTLERTMFCHGDQISGLLVSPDGNRILTSSISDATLRVWDWQNGQKVAEFDSGLPGITDLQWFDDPFGLLMGGKNGTIHLLRLSH